MSKRFRATSFKNAQINAPGYSTRAHESRPAIGAKGWPISEQSHAILEYMKTHGPATAHSIHTDAVAPRWPKWSAAQTRARVQSLVSSGRMKRTQAGMFAQIPDPSTTKESPT